MCRATSAREGRLIEPTEEAPVHAIDPHFQPDLRYRRERLHADYTRPLWWRRRAARHGVRRRA